MATKNTYPLAHLDLKRLAQMLARWLDGKGYETQAFRTPGGLTLQARAKKELMQPGDVAMNVTMVRRAGNLEVEIGTAKWELQAAGGVVAAVVFWPLLALPAFVAYKQQALIVETWEFLEGEIARLQKAALPQANASQARPDATGPQPDEGDGRCPACGRAVSDEAKFCPRCGFRLIKDCPHCSQPIGLFSRFCEHCGQAVDDEPTP